METSAQYRLPRAWYSAPISKFLDQSTEEVIGHLTRNSALNIEPSQRDAWEGSITLLKQHLLGHQGHLLLEFNIPRMGARADAVLLLAGCVLVIEFKVGEKSASSDARNQVWEYALDTKNFHEPSHDLPIIPVLIPTGYQAEALPRRSYAEDGVCQPVAIAPALIPDLLRDLAVSHPGPINAAAWLAGRYKPTPTIVEAARHLYANHSVADIVRT